MRNLSAVATALLIAFPLAARAAEEPTHGTMVASDGVKIHYLTQGRGVPVVLIHGFQGSANGNWFLNGIAPELAKDHYVVAIDCRGHGDSDKPDDPAKYGDRMWQDVVELMDHLNIDQAHVHGYSMGGGITTQLLARHPERFITAIYGGSGIRETDAKQREQIPEDKPGPDPQEAEAVETLRKFATRSDESQKAIQAIRQSFGRRSRPPLDLTKIDIPVLAINGEFDAPNARTHRMQRELSNFKSVVLPGKSHLTAIMMGYMPKQYLESLAEFVRANDPQ